MINRKRQFLSQVMIATWKDKSCDVPPWGSVSGRPPWRKDGQITGCCRITTKIFWKNWPAFGRWWLWLVLFLVGMERSGQEEANHGVGARRISPDRAIGQSQITKRGEITITAIKSLGCPQFKAKVTPFQLFKGQKCGKILRVMWARRGPPNTMVSWAATEKKENLRNIF